MNPKYLLSTVLVTFAFIAGSIPFLSSEARSEIDRSEILKIGKIMPNATLKRYGEGDVEINNLKGKIKIISIVPQLNTPTCDEQTHRFSEQNGGLDQKLDIITISTNTSEGQYQFAQKAKIENLIFLSDNPDYDFGKSTGLLIDGMGVLKRTVLIIDKNNVIRYVDFVRGGGLPNISKALMVAKQILLEAS